MEEPIISKYKECEIAKQGDSQEKKVQERAPVSHEEKVVQPKKMLYRGRHDRNDDPKNKEQTVLKETRKSERSNPEDSIIEEPLKYSPDSKSGLLKYPERHQGAAQENDQGRQDKEETPLGAEEKLVYLEKMQHCQRQDQHDDSLNKNRLLLQESELKEELNREGYEFGGSKLDKGLECSSDHKEKSIDHPVRRQGEKQIEEQQDDAVNAKYLVEQAVIEKTKSSQTITELGAAVSVNNPGITSSDELGKFTGNQTDKRESILPKNKQGDDSQGKQMQEKASESREEKVVYPNKIKYHGNVEKSALKKAGENEHPKSEVANIEESLKSSPDYEDDYQEDYQVKRIQETAVVDHKEQVVHPHEIQNHDRQNNSTNENPSALQETGEQEERKGDSSERKEHFTCSHDFQDSSLEQPEREQVRDRKKLREGNTVNGEILLEQTVSDTTENLETIIEEDTAVSLNNQGKTISDTDDDSKEEVREKAFVGHEEKVVEEIQDKDRQDQCDVLTKKDLSLLLDTDENKEPKLKASKIEAPLKSSPDHDESLPECTERLQEDVATEDHYQVKQEKEKGPLSHEQKNGHLDEMQDRDRHDQQVDPTNREPSVLQETGQNEEPKPEVSKIKEPLKSSLDYEESSLDYTERQQDEVVMEGDSQQKQVEEKGPLSHEEKNGNVDEIQYRSRHNQNVDPTNKDPSLFEETGQNEEPKPEVSKIEEPLKSNPDHEESSLEYTEGQQEDVSTEGDSQEGQIKEKGPLSHEEQNGNLDEMPDGDRHDKKDATTIKEPPVLEETDQNEDPKLQVSKFEEAQKSSPDHEECSFRFTEGQQEKVATECDSQETQVNEKGQLSHEQTIVYFYEKQYRDRHNQQDDPTNKEPSVLDRTGQSEEPKPEMSKIEEPLKSSPNYEESSLEYTERQQEEAATEGDSQQKQVEEKGPLTHEEKNGHLDEMQYRGRQDQQVDPTNKEPSLLEETGQNEEPRPEASKIEKPLKSSPDHEESSLEYTEGQQQDVSTEGDSQEKRVEEKGPLSHEEKNGNVDEIQYRSRHNQNVDPTNKDSSLFEETGQNEEPKPEVSKIEEPLNSNPDHEESSLEYTEGQQEDVSTEGDSQEGQIKEKGPLSHEEQNGNLDEMPDGDRHDKKDATTIKEPPVLEETDQNEDPKLQVPKFEEAQKSSPTIKDLSVFEETGKDKEPKPEVPKIEELLKSSPAHEESLLEYTEGQQEEVATEGDSQETQVNEKGPLSHGEKNGHLDEMQDGDRHDQTDDTTIKEPSVLEETDQNEDPKPEVSKIEEPLKSSPDPEESSLRFTEGQHEKVATEGDSQEKQVNEKGQLGQEQTIVHFYEKQDRDRHNQQDDTTNKEPSVLDKIGQSDEPKPEMSKTEKPLKSSPDRDESSLECTERQPEEFASEGHYQVKQGIDKGPLTHEKKTGHIDEMQYHDRHDLKDNSTIKEPSVLDETGQNKEPKPKEPIIEEPLKSSPDQEQSSLEYSEGQEEEVATKGDSQTKQVKEKEPLSDEQKIVHLHEMQDRDRHDQKDDLTNNEPSVLDETGQNKEPKPEVSMIEEPLKSSPDREESSLEYSKGQQEEVSATEGDSEVKQVEEKGPLSHEQKNGNFEEMQYRNRNDQQVDPTVKEPSVLEETGQNEEPKPEGSKIKEPLKSSPDYEESSLEYTEGQQEEVATEGDSQEKRVEEKGPLSHEEKNGNFYEMQCRDRHDQQVDPTIKEPSVLEETGKNEEPKPEVSKIEEPLKSSPDHEESSLDYTDGQQEEVATEGDSQEKQVKEKGPLSHDKKNGESKEPKPKVPMIEEPLKSSPDQEQSSLEYSEGQQEVVATKGDSQAKQVKEKEPLSDEQKIVHLDEMQDRDRHDQKDDLTNNEPSVLDETEQNKWPKPEVSMIEEPLKSSPDHEESTLEYSEGQQEEVETEGDSQEKQAREKGPLSHEQTNGHLNEMQDRDRHDQKVVPANKEPPVLQETGQNEQPKPEVSEVEEPLKSSPNSLEHPERPQGVVASQDDSRGKREQEKAPMTHGEKCINHEKIQDYDRHDQHDDPRNKNSELQETGENEELKLEGSNLDDSVISNCDNEEMSLEQTERQQVQEKKELRENEAAKVESLVEQPVSDQTESIQTIIEDDAVVTVNNQEISNSNELRISNGKQTDKREPVLPKNKKDVVATQDGSQQVPGEAPVSHGEKVVHLRTIQDYDGRAMHDDPSNNAQSKSVLPETGESKPTTLEEYNIEERLKLYPDYKESSLEYLERHREAATQNDFEEKKVKEKVPLTYEQRSLHPGEMQDHDRHIKLDNSKSKDQSVLQETSENEKPKLHASKIEEPLKSFSNNEDRTLECLERQQKEVATRDDSPVKQVQEKALVGHKDQVMHPDKMEELDRQDQQNVSTSKNQSVLQAKEEHKREGLERKEPLESSYNFEEKLLENLEREQVKNKKKMQEDNAVNDGSVVEQADSDKTECLETINEKHAFVSLNNLMNAISDDDNFQEQQEQDISFVGHEEKFLEELPNRDLIQQHQYGDLTNKDVTVLQETNESQEPKLKATKIAAPLKSTPDYEECSIEYSEKQQEEFDSQDKQVKEKGPSMHEQKIVHLDEMQDLGQHDQQDGPTKKDPSVLQEIGENEEPKLEDAEPEELKIEETLRSSSDYEERSLENPDSNQVQQQKELQKDDVVGENVVEQEVIDKTESIETMIEDISFSASSRVTGDSDEFGNPSSKQTNMTDPILSKCKENEVPLQGDCRDRPVQKEAPVRHQANVVYPEKVEVHDGFYLQDDPANNKQPVVQITNNNEKLKLKEPIKPSFDNEEWSEQREAPVNKKRKSAISLLWCWCCG